MQNNGNWPSRFNLEQNGLKGLKAAHWNLTAPQLIEEALSRSEGVLSDTGALVVRTGQFTGRSPKDKYVVSDETTESAVHWGAVNQPLSEDAFDGIYRRLLRHWEGREVFVQDCFGGAGRANRMAIRVVTELAWHALFGRQLFVRPEPGTTVDHAPEFTLLFAPGFHADPSIDGTNSETCIALNFKRRLVMLKCVFHVL